MWKHAQEDVQYFDRTISGKCDCQVALRLSVTPGNNMKYLFKVCSFTATRYINPVSLATLV